MIRRLIWRSRFWAMVYSAYIAFCLLPLGWVAWTTGIFGLLLVPVLLFLGFLLFALSITAAWPQFVTISQKVMTFGPLWDAVARIDSELSDHSQTIVFGPEP